MAYVQPRKQEPTFRAGMLKQDYCSGPKVRPTNVQATSYQSTCKCSGTEVVKYQAEQENTYEQDVSKIRYRPQQEYISEEDEYSGYNKLSEIGRQAHGRPESPRYYNTAEHKIIYDESEYPREGFQKASDYGYSKVAQNSHVVKHSAARAQGIKEQVVPINRDGGRIYEARVEEKYGYKVQPPPVYGVHDGSMVDKKQLKVHKIQNGHYDSDAEYASHCYKTGHSSSGVQYASHGHTTESMPQPDITEDEAYAKTEHRSVSKYFRPAYWKKEVETVTASTEQSSEIIKNNLVKKKREAKFFEFDIAGKLKL